MEQSMAGNNFIGYIAKKTSSVQIGPNHVQMCQRLYEQRILGFLYFFKLKHKFQTFTTTTQNLNTKFFLCDLCRTESRSVVMFSPGQDQSIQSRNLLAENCLKVVLHAINYIIK